MGNNVGQMTELFSYIIPAGVIIGLILVIAELVFGPSRVTREAQKRLYEQDVEENRKRFEDAVQSEMRRIRNT